MAFPLDLLGPGAIVQVAYDKIRPFTERAELPLHEGRAVRGFVVVKEKTMMVNGAETIAVQLKHPDSPRLWWCWKRECAIFAPGPEEQRFGAREQVGEAAEEEEEEPGAFDLVEGEEEEEPPAPVIGPGMAWSPWNEDTALSLTERSAVKDATQLGVGPETTPQQLLRAFMPTATMERVLRLTSAKLVAARKMALVMDELWAFIAVMQFHELAGLGERKDLWESETKVGLRFDLSSFMTQDRFNNIIKHFTITDEPPPAFRDRVHPVRCLYSDFNAHMAPQLVAPGRVLCLDESMMTFDSSRIPCFMYVPRKPHPAGNEIHTLADGNTGIILRMELVEGKDRPKERGELRYSSDGKTGGLIRRMVHDFRGFGHVKVRVRG